MTKGREKQQSLPGLALLVLIMLSTSSSLRGQSRFGIFAGGGINWYNGDLNDRVTAHPDLFKPYFQGGVLYRLSPRVDVSLNYWRSRIEGADSLSAQKWNVDRNLYFRSEINELSLQFQVRILPPGKNGFRRINPYLFAGVGYLSFNPQALHDDQWVDLQPLGTEGQFIREGQYPAPYKLRQLSAPAGIGVEVSLSRSLALRLELSNHFLFTDYLDDVSGVYADSLSLLNTPNGALAVELASNLPKGYPREGQGRGDPEDNDSFSGVGITLLYTPAGFAEGKGVMGLQKRSRKNNCPAYH